MIVQASAAIAASAVVTSLTDWFFFGVWMHERYRAHPEVWRRAKGGPGENAAVAWSALAYCMTNVAFVGLCVAFGITGLRGAMLAALLAWLAFPLPTLLTNTLFIKLDPVLLIPHGLGWLVRLLATAAIAAWFL